MTRRLPNTRGRARPLLVLLAAAGLGFASMRELRVEGARPAPAAAERAFESSAKPRPPAAPAAPAPRPAAPQPEGPEEAPAAAAKRVLHPRDPAEWQGMRVSLNNPAFCSGKASCGLAKACIDGRCGPCTQGSDCADGEACALDHCLRAELATCTSRRDCGPDELCVLDGYSGGGTRNNERMTSRCLAGVGGVEQREGEHASALGPPEEARQPVEPPSAVDLAALQRQVEGSIVPEEESSADEQAQ